MTGSRWPEGPFFRKITDGKVSAVFPHTGIEEWDDPAGLPLQPSQPALYVPLKVGHERGVLVLANMSHELRMPLNAIIAAGENAMAGDTACSA